MLTTVLRNFGGYCVTQLLDMPFCHFTYLFEMAEVADRLDLYNIYIGSGSHGTDAGQDIANIQHVRYSTKRQFQSIVTPQAKEEAEKQLKDLRNV